MKKIIALLMSVCTLICAMVATACGPQEIGTIDKTKTTLRIANYNGGVGEVWLNNLASKFEEKYADHQFEDGKMGVQVVIDHNKQYNGKELQNSIRSDANNHVYFSQSVSYNLWVQSGFLADITDLVTETKGEDGKKIVDKLSADKQNHLKIDGKYYAVPHYELYSGLQYDAGIFKSKKLYFADTFNSDGTRKFIANPTAKKSCGPDGIYDTYDDGLPSSLEEFYRLIDQMVDNDVIPFVWTGKSTHYTNMLLIALFSNLIGADGYNLLLNFDQAQFDIVTNYAGGSVQTQKETLTKETAYKVKQTEAMYRALEFCEKVFKKDSGYYPISCTGANYSHLDAQRAIWTSGLDGEKPIAMLIDGNYSYNEAKENGILDRLKQYYPTTYTQKDVRYMPMPVQINGTVKEGEGKSQVLVDFVKSYAFINANAKGASLDAAKAFLSFAYTDEQLANFTLDTNGIVKGVSYDLNTIANNASLCENGKTMLKIRQAAVDGGTLVYPFSQERAFLSNVAEFEFGTGGKFWQSKKSTIVFDAFFGDMTASQYFEETQWTPSQWATIINA